MVSMGVTSSSGDRVDDGKSQVGAKLMRWMLPEEALSDG